MSIDASPASPEIRPVDYLLVVAIFAVMALLPFAAVGVDSSGPTEEFDSTVWKSGKRSSDTRWRMRRGAMEAIEPGMREKEVEALLGQWHQDYPLAPGWMYRLGRPTWRGTSYLVVEFDTDRKATGTSLYHRDS